MTCLPNRARPDPKEFAQDTQTINEDECCIRIRSPCPSRTLMPGGIGFMAKASALPMMMQLVMIRADEDG